MNNPRDVILVLGATLLLILLLGLWVAYRNGDISLQSGERVENHKFPLALTDNQEDTPDPMTTSENPMVTLTTTEGDIVIELYQDVMPITSGNFLSLVQSGFYDGTKFHRVIDGFMIQGGDPNTKTDNVASYGTGGPGYAIEDEQVVDERLSNVRGTISMANSGPQSGGSQFFINLVDNTGLDFDKQPLSSKHPVFGRVVSGMEVVDAIAKVPTNPRDLPLEAVVVEKAVVAEGERKGK